MLHENLLTRAGEHNLKATRQADLSVFDDSEKEVLKNIAKLTEKDGGKNLLE